MISSSCPHGTMVLHPPRKRSPLDIQVRFLVRAFMVFDRNIYISGKNNLTMSQIDITKMSSKGQVVIPQDLRKGISDGDKLVVIRNKDQIILKKADNFDKNLENDLEFAKRTEKAWKEVERGKFKRMSPQDFLKEIRSLK